MVSATITPGNTRPPKKTKPAKPRPVPPHLTDDVLAEYHRLLESGADPALISAAADRLSDLLRQQAAYQAPRQARRAKQAAKRAAKAAERAADPLAYRRPDQDLIDANRWAKEHLFPLRWAIDEPRFGPTNESILARLRGAKAADSTDAIAPKYLQAARNSDKKFYCHSGAEKGILTLDLDAHRIDQYLSDACAAKDAILAEWERITGSPLRGADYESSGRGRHFSVGVNFEGRAAADVVSIYRRLEHAIARMLPSRGHLNMVGSVEVKGAPAVIEADLSTMRAGQYTQLPVRREHEIPLQWLIYSRDTPISQIEFVAAQLESLYPPIPAQQPISAPSAPTPTAQRIPDSRGQYPPPWWAGATTTIAPQPIAAAPAQSITSSSSSSLGPGSPPFWVVPPAQSHLPQQTADWEPNSFVRQSRALRRYSRQLRRVPTVDEALDHIRTNSLHTGDWSDNQSGRESRVEDILGFISRNFDSSKSQGSPSQDPRCESELQRQIRRARKEIPHGKYLGGILISPEELGTMRYLCWFRIAFSPNKDQSAPRNSFEERWNKLHSEGKIGTKFDKKKWKLMRESLESAGELEVFDKSYGRNEAMKWRILPGFHFAGQGMSHRPIPQLTASQRLRRDSYSQRVTAEFFLSNSGGADLDSQREHNLMGSPLSPNSPNSPNLPGNSLTEQDRPPPPLD